jgi:hypothetical protein
MSKICWRLLAVVMFPLLIAALIVTVALMLPLCLIGWVATGDDLAGIEPLWFVFDLWDDLLAKGRA